MACDTGEAICVFRPPPIAPLPQPLKTRSRGCSHGSRGLQQGTNDYARSRHFSGDDTFTKGFVRTSSACLDSPRYFAEIHDCAKLFDQKAKPAIGAAQKYVFRLDQFVSQYCSSEPSLRVGDPFFRGRFHFPANKPISGAARILRLQPVLQIWQKLPRLFIWRFWTTKNSEEATRARFVFPPAPLLVEATQFAPIQIDALHATKIDHSNAAVRL